VDQRRLKSIARKILKKIQFVRETGYVVLREKNSVTSTPYALPGGTKNKIYYDPRLPLVELMVDLEMLCYKIIDLPPHVSSATLDELQVELYHLTKELEKLTGV